MSSVAAKVWTLSDAELARRAAAGASPCFEELVRRYQAPLLRYLGRRFGLGDDAPDVLQETFLRAYQHLDDYDDRWPLRTWLFTIAHHAAVSHGRTLRRRREEPLGTDGPDAWPRPDEPMMRQEESGQLWHKARQILEDEPFGAVWLFYVEEMTAPQIARVLGRSWVSVKTMLHRARRKLLAELRPPAGHVGADAPTIKAGET